MKRRHFTALAAAALAPAFGFAQERVTRILVGFPPGGSADQVARLLADKLRMSLGQNVIVDNKPGAAGRLALTELKRAAPDGGTLLFTPSGAMVIHPWLYQNLGYDTAKDFTPIAQACVFDFAVTAGPGAVPGDLKTVLAWMKANPGKANYATSGAGTVPHFAGQLLAQAAEVPMTHVAYRGGAPAAQDLIGGQVPLMVDTASETIEHHRAGKVRILAMTGTQRNRALPEVPTLKEAGIDVSADAFFGLYGPPGLPPELTQRLDRAVADALRAQDVQDKIFNLGLVPAHAGPFELATIQAAHLKRWEAPIKASGFKAE
ncbi:Bug family tripartite tricarboxylate transporter substrate binding protein [Variovorax sp. KK3]|uniref:Bug family tripartite tricarboxylate transporter substrate binding protein n=1 Tax=Variovorax sp. KK3 TaxID=1855728 RepID=UPI00097C51A8|nr:Bug family tripartite tricarboxylate transporter substrate binding protein [Variovorax sp. KK3]